LARCFPPTKFSLASVITPKNKFANGHLIIVYATENSLNNPGRITNIFTIKIKVIQ
jgi:hypothetical protein